METAPPPCYLKAMAKPQPRPSIDPGIDPPLSPEDEAKLAALRADIDEAYDALMRGDVVDGNVVFAELYAKFGRPPGNSLDNDAFEDD